METLHATNCRSAEFGTLFRKRIEGLLSYRSFKSEAALWGVAFVLLGLAYFMQFQFVRDETILQSIKNTLVNIVPIVLVGVSIRLLVRRYLLKLPLIGQLSGHFVLAIIFTHVWYLLILVTASFRLDWLTSGMTLSPFYESATLWQLLQGVVIYAALQGLIYGRWLQERLHAVERRLEDALQHQPNTTGDGAAAVFVKAEGEFRQIDLEDLPHIEANGDQVLLHTKLGQFSCNKALSEYAQKLEDSGYIRIHRSHLVRAAAILGAEPTGDGRLSIHLDTGTSIIASRSGTRAFKEFTR
ncbi:MAG: hypothetical protein Hens2KO_09530 [Henriciella sp.]